MVYTIKPKPNILFLLILVSIAYVAFHVRSHDCIIADARWRLTICQNLRALYRVINTIISKTFFGIKNSVASHLYEPYKNPTTRGLLEFELRCVQCGYGS